jgi:hypothetical protein
MVRLRAISPKGPVLLGRLYVKEQMGHSSIQVTVDIYGHLIPGADVSFVDRLDEAPEAKKRNENLETSAQESASPAQVTPNEETVIPWQVIDLIGGGAWTLTTDLRIMRSSIAERLRNSDAVPGTPMRRKGHKKAIRRSDPASSRRDLS